MTTLTEADAVDGLRDALGLLKDREQVAERLLASSARHSFDPDKELDWDAPFEDGTPRSGNGWARNSASCSPSTRPPRSLPSGSGSS
jgi:hypothetical protein